MEEVLPRLSLVNDSLLFWVGGYANRFPKNEELLTQALGKGPMIPPAN